MNVDSPTTHYVLRTTPRTTFQKASKSNESALFFEQIARLPLPGDNVAIAIRRLRQAARSITPVSSFRLSHTVMEGHRFAVKTIAEGEALLSWSCPWLRTVHNRSGRIC